MNDKTVLRPGQQTDMVIGVDEAKESIDVRQSIVYDVVDEVVTVAQPTPPLARYDIQKDILVTVLSRRGDTPVRHAIPVRVKELLRDYRLASDKTVGAVNLEIIGEPYEFNLRMHYRVRPFLDSGLDLVIAGAKVSIIDISIGGAKILLDGEVQLNPGSIVGGKLIIDGNEHEIRCRVLRRWDRSVLSSGRSFDYLVFATVRFIAVGKETERRLSQKIREIERILRQRELDLKAERDRKDILS